MIHTLTAPATDGFSEMFERKVLPNLVAGGVRPFALFETESAPNTFPRLPVREGEHAFVWFARFSGLAGYERWDGKRAGVPDAEIWRLAPTARSRRIRQ